MKQVKIYSSPTCGYCQLAKEYFDQNSIQYEEYNVLEDEARRAELIEKSGQMGVPVIFVDEEMVIGFDRDHLATLLKISA
jgi:glutaredoxin 3